MDKEYFEIKDKCRKGLLKYLAKAISILPVTETPRILDIGCGSGVPTLMLAEKFNGRITAVDPDTKSINILREKVKELKLSDRITLFNCSFFDIRVGNGQYDLVLAEGLLNAVGFQKGFLRILELLKRKGFIIIHDEFRDQDERTGFIRDNNCKLLDSFVLDEHAWWNDYFKCLEKEISSNPDNELLKLFESDRQEIKMFRENPSQYTSVYYIIQRM